MSKHTVTPSSAPRTSAIYLPRSEAAEASEVSELARHRDPSLTGVARTAARRPSGVDWVRPSELLTSRSGRIAGLGLDFQAELARRARRLPVGATLATGRGVRQAAAGFSDRARRLPPVSAFGRGAGARFSWMSRSGIGLG